MELRIIWLLIIVLMTWVDADPTSSDDIQSLRETVLNLQSKSSKLQRKFCNFYVSFYNQYELNYYKPELSPFTVHECNRTTFMKQFHDKVELYNKAIDVMKGEAEDIKESIEKQDQPPDSKVFEEAQRKISLLSTDLVELQEDLAEQKNETEQAQQYFASTAVKTILKIKSTIHCKERFEEGDVDDGVYTISVGGKPVDVWCDMKNGGWIVLQNRERETGKLYHRKRMSHYAEGFGNVTGQHWLGLNTASELTKYGNWTLRVELKTDDNETGWAEYSELRIGEGTDFQLYFDKSSYRGTLGDALQDNYGLKFTTYDMDQDLSKTLNCAKNMISYSYPGWWYNYYYLRDQPENWEYVRKDNVCTQALTTADRAIWNGGAIMWKPWKHAVNSTSAIIKIRRSN